MHGPEFCGNLFTGTPKELRNGKRLNEGIKNGIILEIEVQGAATDLTKKILPGGQLRIFSYSRARNTKGRTSERDTYKAEV